MLKVNQQNGVVFESLFEKQLILQEELKNLMDILSNHPDMIVSHSDKYNVQKEIDLSKQFFNNTEISERTISTLTTHLDSGTDASSDDVLRAIGQTDMLYNLSESSPIQDFNLMTSRYADDNLPCTSSVSNLSSCKPLIKCFAFYADIPELRKQPCQLQDGEFGICCPVEQAAQGTNY